MKIIFDKTKDNYQYPISQKDLKLLFQIIPENWKSGIKTIHFLGQEPDKTRFERPVNKISLSNKLNLSVLGLSEKDIITEILIELVQDSDFGNLRAASYKKLTKVQTAKIKEIIEPYMLRYLSEKQENKNGA
ncbi:MAG TPA: hypothetical protein VN182_01060 [Flavobacterium sp.]|nr:hypothetical protein [Flavobacterium sp.]